MSDNVLTTILEGIGEGFYAVDRDWRIVLFNSEAARHFHCRAEDVVGRILWEVFPGAKDTLLGDLFVRTMASRETIKSETPSVVVPGRWLTYRLFPVGDGMGVVFRDVTDHKNAEDALSASEEQFRNLAESLPHLIWVMRSDGLATYFNRRFKEYHGYEVSADLADRSSNIHPDDKPAAFALRQRTIAAGLPFETELRLRRHDGEYRWFRMSAMPLQRDGQVTVYVGIAIDIHDMRMAEQQLTRHVRHQDLLINELNHRVKNTLTIIQSIAAQTWRDAKPALRQSFEARLHALAGAYDVLTRENWEGADLQDIVAQATLPFENAGRRQFEIVGEPCTLSPGVALTVSMALHELGTNAAKYGALTTEAGQVLVAWDRLADHVELRWMESGGPTVVPPSRRGFGSRLLKMSFRDAEPGGIEIRFLPAGVTCQMHIPLVSASAAPNAIQRPVSAAAG